MINLKTGEVDTEHSIFAVPFILVNDKLKNTPKTGGSLCDIAPTILDIVARKTRRDDRKKFID